MTDWRERASCRGLATRTRDPWHPPGESSEYDALIAHAKRVCGWCPVRQRCLDDADAIETTSTTWGIRGGETAAERTARRRATGLTRRSKYRPDDGPRRPPADLVDVTRFRDDLQRLRAGGLRVIEIAHRCGIPQSAISLIASGRQLLATPATAEALTRMHTPLDEAGRAALDAACAAGSARRMARARAAAGRAS